MRAREFIKEEKIDEVLPALGMLGRAAVSVGSAAARTAAKAATTGAKTLAKKGFGTMTKNVFQNPSANNANVKNKQLDKAKNMASDQLKKQLVKKGARLPLPTVNDPKKTQDFEIDSVRGKEVVIKNPKPKPGEPLKTVHSIDDLDPHIQRLIGK